MRKGNGKLKFIYDLLGGCEEASIKRKGKSNVTAWRRPTFTETQIRQNFRLHRREEKKSLRTYKEWKHFCHYQPDPYWPSPYARSPDAYNVKSIPNLWTILIIHGAELKSTLVSDVVTLRMHDRVLIRNRELCNIALLCIENFYCVAGGHNYRASGDRKKVSIG